MMMMMMTYYALPVCRQHRLLHDALRDGTHENRLGQAGRRGSIGAVGSSRDVVVTRIQRGIELRQRWQHICLQTGTHLPPPEHTKTHWQIVGL